MRSAVLLISCDERTDISGSPNESDHMTVARNNYENSREIYRAIETGDVSKLDSNDIVGRDSVKYSISQNHNYFDGLKVEHVIFHPTHFPK